MKIEQKVAIVTGGANDIGKGVVDLLLEKGAKLVAILDYDSNAGEKTAEEFGLKHGSERVFFYTCDVSSEEQLNAAFAAVYDKYKQIDIVINNAGIAMEKEDIFEMYDKTLNILLCAVIKGTYLAKRYMSKVNGGKGGVVVNTASVSGLYPSAWPVYGAAKHGVIGMTRCLPIADEAFMSDIRIGAICPGFVATSMVGIGDIDDRNQYNPVPVSMVVDGFQKFIEDDTMNGSIIKVTHGTGIAVHQYPTAEEIEQKCKLYK